MNDKYAWACGYLASAVHQALRELSIATARLLLDDPSDARRPVNDALTHLRDALIKLQEHGIELHWPDDLKENAIAASKNRV